MWNKAEEDVMTESGVCVYVFCLLSSCSCTHTHCARRGINCPCSAIVTLLANLQGALKSRPFQGPQYTSKEKPFSPPQILPYPFPCPVLSCPLLPFPCPAVLCSCHLSAQALGWPRAIARDGAPTQHMADTRLHARRLGPQPHTESASSGEIHEKEHACLFCQDRYPLDTARDELRRGAHLDETVLVRPKGPCFTRLPCFAAAHPIQHDISPTLNLHILNSTPQLPYCDLAAIRV